MVDFTTDSHIAERVKEIVKAINRGEGELILPYVGAEVVIRDAYSGLPSGREGMKLRLHLWEAALADLVVVVESCTVSGNHADATVSWSGTHVGELFGDPGTGKRVTFRSRISTMWNAGVLTEFSCMADDVDVGLTSKGE